ncbi:hypothetical protein SCHPADRAFT_898823 [Schizopora paradoxa]|uniref:Uncharacterized protein n=1 Tax=Schizopora paradoxa TaxID=27342 RepID=A0A0H2S6H5_9AGAM|nr:hypothetical protein SCHPADRAFT_898823 [Schizopora paradoxa]
MANPNEPDSAQLLRIRSLDSSKLGRKLRIAGRIVSFDPDTHVLLLRDEANNAILVDSSQCIDPSKSHLWLRDKGSPVVALGYLEENKDDLPIPTLPAFAQAPEIDPSICLQALLLLPSPDLDLKLWEDGIRLREETFSTRASVG